jgi:hypothetical protein
MQTEDGQMKKKVCAWLLVISVLLPCAAVFPVPGLAAASGEWVLTEVEDTIPEDRTRKSEDPPYSRVHSETFHYAPSEYSRDWVSDTTGYDGKKTHEEGTNSIRFSAMPQRIRPGETVTITAAVSVTSSGVDMDESGDSLGYTAWAELPQEIPAEAIDEGEHRYEYLVPLFAKNFTSSHKISFSMPEGDPGTDSVHFDFGLPMGGEERTFSTRYTYKWVTAAAPTATQKPEASDAIALKGVALSAEAKPMRWMKLDAQVYYGQERYDSAKEPDAVIQSATDHEGRYSISIPIQENDTEPVGILLTGTFKCVYPFDGGHDAFYFVDMQDDYSQSSDRLDLSSWITVNPEAHADAAKDQPISVYRLLSFYHLGVDGWSFSLDPERFGPDPVYYYSTDPDQPERLANYSALYTAAFDAWFFGAAVLGEKDKLITKPLRIEVRWPLDPAIGASHYHPTDHCIRLEEIDSLRDDNSRFAILHEFGHAFDCITNDGVYRAYAEYDGSGNVNHGGYMNDTTSDSYIEGFATFFAGTVQLYSGYENPGTLCPIVLADPGLYTAWGRHGKNEEYAIATLLYNTHDLVDDIEAYWSILDVDRANFFEYYTEIKNYLAERSPNSAERLRQYAIYGGLYRMPFGGNGSYDSGEPFRDLTGGTAGRRDSNEPYADLMFGVDENGVMDPTKPLQQYDESDLVAGEVSDASRVRKTIEDPPSGYLYLSGEATEYLLVDILPDGEAGSRTLRAVVGNKVLIGLPDKELTGAVKVLVPGGNVIYEGDMAELQRRQTENAGQAVPLAEARIDVNDLAAPGTEAAATYGSVDASGVLSISEMSREELVRLSDGYDKDASFGEVAAALAARKGRWSDTPSGGRPVLLYVAASTGALMIAALILFFFARRKRSSTGPQPPGVCPNCGASLSEGARFCTGCGKAVAEAPEKPPACAGCGAELAPNAGFCSVCGRPAPAAPPEVHVPLRSPKPRLWLVIAAVAAGAAALCVGAHFLFFTGKQGSAQTVVVSSAAPTAGQSQAVTAQPTPVNTAEMVTAKTISIDIAYDSGEGVYTGEVENGVPNGQGRFEMVKSDNGKAWSYEGQWEEGEIAGEGIMTQGTLVFTGSFSGGLLNGNCEVTDNSVLRYKGMCKDGKLHGQGTLYTKSGMLLFKGAFKNDMLVEDPAAREKRGKAFMHECDAMDSRMYAACMAEDNTSGRLVAVWGFVLGMSDQTANGTVIIGHMGEDQYPVCLVYRYGVDEAKMTRDDWINAWGVVTGTYEYKDADGLTVTCPMVEVVYWNNEQEGL